MKEKSNFFMASTDRPTVDPTRMRPGPTWLLSPSCKKREKVGPLPLMRKVGRVRLGAARTQEMRDAVGGQSASSFPRGQKAATVSLG